LLLIIVSLQSVFFFFDFSSEETIDFSSKEIALFQTEMDSLSKVDLKNRTPKIYPFNPNFITDYKGSQLGMSIEEIDNLHAFRSKGSYINSVKQFQKITKINDSLLSKISPYFKFPEWVTASTTILKSESRNKTKNPIVKQDINLVNAQS